MSYNNKLKLDTTILQSNTVQHLMQFIINQRDAVTKLVSFIEKYDAPGFNHKAKDVDINLQNLNDDYEYISTKHMDALHKRIGTNIYGLKKEKEYFPKKEG
tara:strand:+ start:8456 stop:8758 length:303 start_codon:yes stop_codon:yes gene_type:complete